eukprot:1156584-Pelagomonas_calceolata.AAC.11
MRGAVCHSRLASSSGASASLLPRGLASTIYARRPTALSPSGQQPQKSPSSHSLRWSSLALPKTRGMMSALQPIGSINSSSSSSSSSSPSGINSSSTASQSHHQGSQQQHGQQASSPAQLPPYGMLFVTATLPLLHALAVVLGFLSRGVDAIRQAVAALFPQMEGVSREVSALTAS